ncbi:hypothetical protein D3C71_1724880 [compost metagenome]
MFAHQPLRVFGVGHPVPATVRIHRQHWAEVAGELAMAAGQQHAVSGFDTVGHQQLAAQDFPQRQGTALHAARAGAEHHVAGMLGDLRPLGLALDFIFGDAAAATLGGCCCHGLLEKHSRSAQEGPSQHAPGSRLVPALRRFA